MHLCRTITVAITVTICRVGEVMCCNSRFCSIVVLCRSTPGMTLLPFHFGRGWCAIFVAIVIVVTIAVTTAVVAIAIVALLIVVVVIEIHLDQLLL